MSLPIETLREIARNPSVYGKEAQLEAIRHLGQNRDLNMLRNLAKFPDLYNSKGDAQNVAFDELVKIADVETMRDLAKYPGLSGKSIQLRAINVLISKAEVGLLEELAKYPALYGMDASTLAGKYLASKLAPSANANGDHSEFPKQPMTTSIATTNIAMGETRRFEYDAFICHASEDKKEIAEPLAKMLVKRGLKVWYDQFTLKVGDSLRQKIDYGLARSRYGIVILSQFFFKKNWPQKELNGLVAREDSEGHKVILPVWHQVDQDYVVKYSPILADKLASNTNKGMQTVLAELLEVISESTTPKNQTSQEGTELKRQGRAAADTTVVPESDIDAPTQRDKDRRWLLEPDTRATVKERLARGNAILRHTLDSLAKEAEDGSVKEDDLIVALQSNKLKRNESLEIVQLALMEGILYQPKPGYLKKTIMP